MSNASCFALLLHYYPNNDGAGHTLWVSIPAWITTDTGGGMITSGTVTSVNSVATFTGITLGGLFGARTCWFAAPSTPITAIFRITIGP